MKKITIAVLVFVLIATLAACGCQSRTDTNNGGTTTETTTTPTTATIIDPTIIDPTIMDPTIETNIPDPDINTESTNGTDHTGGIIDDNATNSTGAQNMK